ncbi:Transcriptional factor B3 family protein [Euphorbia peplus]|nr:Transcriptional factor B3 family protein [Euphorbia peplus]
MSTTLYTQPHFFKPLLPGFEDDFVIPIAFFKYFEQGHEQAQASLRTRQCGKHWPVKINGKRFGDGWKQFVQDHDLRVADFLVFRYDGDLLFFVFIFDRTTCERLYLPFREEEDVPIQELDVPVFADTGKKFEKKKNVTCKLEADGGPSVVEHPYCVIKLTPDSFKSSRLRIPRKFAREHDLYGRCCSMILKDENGSCWPAKLLYKSSNSKSYIAGGWTAFHDSHKLKAGDLLVLELTRNGNIPVVKMLRSQEHPEVRDEVIYQNNAQATSSSTGHLPSTMEPSNHEKFELKTPKEEAKEFGQETPEEAKESGSWKWRKHKWPNTISEAQASSRVVQKGLVVAKVESNSSHLAIPESFARRHFRKKTYNKVIIVDREKRSWPASLYHTEHYAYIEDDSIKFRTANNLKLGDSVVFECIEMGNKLAFKVYGFKDNRKDGKNQEKCCLYLTMVASNIRNNQIRIPSEFARTNGLGSTSSMSSEMTITNERGNSWQMTLKVDKCGGFFVRNGWIKFAEENGIKEGDVFMLEVLKGGTKPSLKYYAAKQDMDSNLKFMWKHFEDSS